MDSYIRKLVGQEAAFPTNYARWCRDNMACTSLSLGQVNSTYIELTSGILASRKPKHLTRVVDEVVETEICEMCPGKVRKTLVFKCEVAAMPYKPMISCEKPLETPILDEITGRLFNADSYFS